MTALLSAYHPAIRTVDRLVDLARLGLDREAERPFLRDLVDRVANCLDTPFAMIDVLLNDAQVFLAGHGPVPEWIQESGGTPLEWAFCQPLVTERVPRCVADLTVDPLFHDNPLVTIAGVRAYAGAPLVSLSGHVLGGICGLDVKPRVFSRAELVFLQATAAEVVERLEERADRP
ncbi:GAF domain-containing protein [Actinoplanes sp. NPDC026619]|uniref:GAF domain-containing protein n=1 Tax=Actinoplanes sp. NPDC026619 TaxID=3155798 RepID=UPI0033FD5BD8